MLKKNNRRAGAVMLVMAVLTAAVFLLSMNMGEIRIDPLATLRTLFGFGTPQDELVLFEFRLPRMILAMLIGAGVAVSGAVWQGISRNDLADPGILGINTGAGFAVVLFIFYFQGDVGNLQKDSFFPADIRIFGSLLCSRFHLFAGVEKRLESHSPRFGRHRSECGVFGGHLNAAA